MNPHTSASAPGRTFVFSREYPPTTVGGTSTVARNLSTGLRAEGHDVTVITTLPGTPDAERENTDEVLDGVRVHRVGTSSVYHTDTGLSDQSIRVHRRLYEAAEQLAAQAAPPDVVIMPDLFCYPEAAMFARRHHVPLINILLQDFRAITPYDRDGHRVTSGVSAEREHLLDLERKAVHRSDHTVFISRALADATTGYYPGNTAPSGVVHLGVDPAEIAAVEADPLPWSRRRRLPGTGANGPLLVACGRLVPVKGFDILLTALARLGSVHRPGASQEEPHLVLVGVGPEEPHLRRLAADLGITDRISFLGDIPRRDALGWMSVADVAVVPSLWESFCYVCAEMMAFGRPVVSAAVDSLRELVPSEEYGYPVRVDGPSGQRTLSPDALASSLRQALAHPAEARRRGEAARRRIFGHFTNTTFAAGISALTRDLTEGAR
ncbi:glycosyltransferase family 4 protein [Streptomyces sp. NPDC048428]|uniref:glycosyltransferase family 4 protein n=1 Tax=Streptomyces sp. NPDC048428 TaxID=3154503 RepID=UPI00342B6041